jgi:hypothetical protein
VTKRGIFVANFPLNNVDYVAVKSASGQ